MAELLLITPARDEAAHLEPRSAPWPRRPQRPDLWLIVDDGSTTRPRNPCASRQRMPFLRVLQAPQNAAANEDRLALAAEARAFNWAMGSLDPQRYTTSASSTPTSSCPRSTSSG